MKVAFPAMSRKAMPSCWQFVWHQVWHTAQTQSALAELIELSFDLSGDAPTGRRGFRLHGVAVFFRSTMSIRHRAATLLPG